MLTIDDWREIKDIVQEVNCRKNAYGIISPSHKSFLRTGGFTVHFTGSDKDTDAWRSFFLTSTEDKNIEEVHEKRTAYGRLVSVKYVMMLGSTDTE